MSKIKGFKIIRSPIGKQKDGLSYTVREDEKKRQPSLLRSRADPKLRRMLPSMSACRNSPAPEDSPLGFPRHAECNRRPT